jgi:hypothetical protein
MAGATGLLQRDISIQFGRPLNCGRVTPKLRAHSVLRFCALSAPVTVSRPEHVFAPGSVAVPCAEGFPAASFGCKDSRLRALLRNCARWGRKM